MVHPTSLFTQPAILVNEEKNYSWQIFINFITITWFTGHGGWEGGWNGAEGASGAGSGAGHHHEG